MEQPLTPWAWHARALSLHHAATTQAGRSRATEAGLSTKLQNSEAGLSEVRPDIVRMADEPDNQARPRCDLIAQALAGRSSKCRQQTIEKQLSLLATSNPGPDPPSACHEQPRTGSPADRIPRVVI